MDDDPFLFPFLMYFQVDVVQDVSKSRSVRITTSQALASLCRGPKALEEEELLRSSLTSVKSSTKGQAVMTRNIDEGLEALKTARLNLEKEIKEKEENERKLKQGEDKQELSGDNQVRRAYVLWHCIAFSSLTPILRSFGFKNGRVSSSHYRGICHGIVSISCSRGNPMSRDQTSLSSFLLLRR